MNQGDLDNSDDGNGFAITAEKKNAPIDEVAKMFNWLIQLPVGRALITE